MAYPVETVAVDPREALRDQVVNARRRAHQFFLAITVFLIATVVVGFWPSYFGQLARGGVTRPWIMHAHGAVFTGWMALLLLQVALAATGRVHLHRRIGTAGIAYGGLVLLLGTIVTFVATARHIRAGEWTLDAGAAFLILPIVDMILFGGFIAAAVAYRHTPDIHKRLIVAATVALAFAAVGRMNLSLSLFFMLWLSPMAAAMLFDFRTSGRVHPVNIVSTAILAIAFLRIFLMESEGWMAIGRALLAPWL